MTPLPIPQIIFSIMSTDSNVIILKGLTLVAATQEGDDRMTLKTSGGRSFLFYHSQDCCESVSIETIEGNLEDLIGMPLIEATEEIESDGNIIRAFFNWGDDRYIESATLTIFAFATPKGRVVVKWLGESNGYYSESVSFVETTKGEPSW